MKNLFLSYKLSSIAKEKGFDEPCLAKYILIGDWILHIGTYNELNPDYVLNAPIYQQILDWFRTKHNLHIEVFNQLRPANNFMYGYKLGSSTQGIEDGFTSYYSALDKAIEESFKLI